VNNDIELTLVDNKRRQSKKDARSGPKKTIRNRILKKLDVGFFSFFRPRMAIRKVDLV